MKPRFFLLVILFILTYQLALTQTKITGKIRDAEDNEALELVNVSLLKSDSAFLKGVLSDEKGCFMLDNIPSSNYILRFESVGYTNSSIVLENLNKDLDLGEILMQKSDLMLKDVTVTASAIIQKADRKVIIPSEAQIKSSNSGVTLLRNLQLSRIMVDPINNTISVPGGGNVQLRINGVEVTQAELIALQPADIVRIEYHEDPGMRYNNAAAVLDYITRRKESGGNVSTNLTNAFSNVGFAEDHLSAKVNHKKSEFGVNAYWHYRDLKWTRQNTETFNLESEKITRIETGKPTKFNEKQLNLNVNYNLQDADNYLFNVTLRNTIEDVPNQFTDRNSVLTSSTGAQPLSISDHSTWKSYIPTLDLYYQRNLKNNQLLIFNAVGTYIDSKSMRIYTETRNNVATTDIHSFITGDKYSLILEGIYEKSFDKSKISGGVKYNQSYTKNVYDGDVSTSIGLNYSETYAYAEYQSRREKFNYMLGLGVMRSYNKQGSESNESYIFRPAVRITYNFNDNSFVRYNGFIAGSSPSLSDINNVTQQIDSLQIRKGNPNLKAVWFFTNSIAAGYSKGIFGIELFSDYSYDHTPIMEQKTVEDGMVIITNVNNKAFHRIRVESTFKLRLWKDYISLSVTPGVRRFISDGNSYRHTHNSYYFRASANVNYKNWMLNTEIYTRQNWLWGETLNSGENFHSIRAGYNKQKWSLSLGVMLPFSKTYSQYIENYSAVASSYSRAASDKLTQLFFANFSYNFSFGRQYKSAGKRLNNDDSDAGIMKGSK